MANADIPPDAGPLAELNNDLANILKAFRAARP